jgi:hypothetical protein
VGEFVAGILGLCILADPVFAIQGKLPFVSSDIKAEGSTDGAVVRRSHKKSEQICYA